MRHNINIITENQKFPFIIEYCGKQPESREKWATWSACTLNDDCIHLFSDDIQWMRHNNNWYSAKDSHKLDLCIPEIVDIAKLKLHIPSYNPSMFMKNLKYMLTINTWINGYKIDFGSYLLDPLDAIANTDGPLKNGNEEYVECVELEILEPFSIVYSDKWLDFREEVCDEPHGTNDTGSLLAVSLYIVKETNDGYMIYPDCCGGITTINMSNETDYMNLNILPDKLDNRKLLFEVPFNSEYNDLLNYIYETYGIETKEGAPHIDKNNGLFFEVMIKNKNSIIVGPRIGYSRESCKLEFGKTTQYITIDNIMNAEGGSEIKRFFSTWENFEEGWNICGALVVYDEEMEILYVLSNDLPITQELFSKYVDSSEKIIDLNDMKIESYNIIHKMPVENNVHINEVKSNSKSNIIQPVFFRVKTEETLTIHPNITENICINLNEYKNKVDRFSLQINNTIFNQIGANGYGIIFKIVGNKLPSNTTSGIYYILNENLELVTSGKYNCAK